VSRPPKLRLKTDFSGRRPGLGGAGRRIESRIEKKGLFANNRTLRNGIQSLPYFSRAFFLI
jgi:hypothetical protein